MTSPFRSGRWDEISGSEFTDITYHRARDVVAVRTAFNRPEVCNASRPYTVDELVTALEYVHISADIGCALPTGNGLSLRGSGWAFYSDGDQRVWGRAGYQYASGETANTVDKARLVRLHILEAQRLTRFMSKVVTALVNGWAADDGYSLHVIPDLIIASCEHVCSKQTDVDVGSFDGGFDFAYPTRQMGQKSARQISFLGDVRGAQEAHEMGMVSKVVPHEELEEVGLEWAARIYGRPPTT